MNITTLKEELIINNINLKACLIYPKICPEGALCLLKDDDDSWSVILNERGSFNIKEKFYNESDACRFFFLKVISDPTNRNDFKQTDLHTFKEKKEKLLKKYGYL